MKPEPARIEDFMTAITYIAGVLILVCSVSGAAMPYVKGGKMFVFARYLVEVISSAAAGVIVFLILRVTDMPEEWIAALSGLSAYFGTRLMNVLYSILVGRLKIIFHDKNDDENGGQK